LILLRSAASACRSVSRASPSRPTSPSTQSAEFHTRLRHGFEIGFECTGEGGPLIGNARDLRGDELRDPGLELTALIVELAQIASHLAGQSLPAVLESANILGDKPPQTFPDVEVRFRKLANVIRNLRRKRVTA
jgi:hypothetical protein